MKNRMGHTCEFYNVLNIHKIFSFFPFENIKWTFGIKKTFEQIEAITSIYLIYGAIIQFKMKIDIAYLLHNLECSKLPDKPVKASESIRPSIAWLKSSM